MYKDFVFTQMPFSVLARFLLRVAMQKSIHRPHHKAVCARLREAREQAGLTQVQLAALFKNTQAWVSSVETGLTRLDLVQVWEWCRACGTTLAALAAAVEADFGALPSETPVRRRGGGRKTGTRKAPSK